MRHGFFITCLTANQACPIMDVALMADIFGRSLLPDTVCNEDKSDYTKYVGCPEGVRKGSLCGLKNAACPQ